MVPDRGVKRAGGTPSQSGYNQAVSPTPRFVLREVQQKEASALASELGTSQGLAQTLLHRGLSQVNEARSFLSPRLQDLGSPDTILDSDVAVDRVVHSIRAGKQIVVFGDYDVDGTTSAALLQQTLSSLGGDVRALAANRFEGGYGLSDRALDRILEHHPDLLITCDCGSADHDRIARATAAGVDTIVIDHHLVPEQPLPAMAFLNPHRPECNSEFKGYASVGLAFLWSAQVRKRLGLKLDLRPWLDLVAMGTIADMAPLEGDNRRLARAGLAMLHNQGRPAVRALLELVGVPSAPRALDVAFRLAPRLNAPGRLGQTDLTLELLLANDIDQARAIAGRVEQINQKRKTLESQATEQAIAQVERIYGAEPSSAIVVAEQGWHPGVVGITAARLVDRYQVPVLVAALDGESGRGSGRTPTGISLHDALSACEDVLQGFGGHHAAVGFNVESNRIKTLRDRFAQACASLSKDVAPIHWVDGLWNPGEPLQWTSKDLQTLEPVGQGNPEPLFVAKGARITRAPGEHLQASLATSDGPLAIWGWNMGPQLAQKKPGEIVDVAGHLRLNSWRGREELRLEAKYLVNQPIEQASHG